MASHLVRSNQEWALDFVCDTLGTGRGIRVLAVVDAFTRENLSLEVDTSLSSRRVTRSLEGVIERRGKPEAIRCDNGPELTSPALPELVGGAEDSTDPHSTRTADAERARREFQRSIAGRNANWFRNLMHYGAKIGCLARRVQWRTAPQQPGISGRQMSSPKP